MNELLELIKPLLLAYGGDFGIVIQVISFIGSLRLINKPLFSFLNAVVSFTYWTEKDNLLLSKVESSKIYKGIVYFIDWVASAKLGKK